MIRNKAIWFIKIDLFNSDQNKNITNFKIIDMKLIVVNYWNMQFAKLMNQIYQKLFDFR